MFAYWKRLRLMPWQWGLTKEPCVEHIKALYEMDRMVRDADRMYKEMGKDQEQQPPRRPPPKLR